MTVNIYIRDGEKIIDYNTLNEKEKLEVVQRLNEQAARTIRIKVGN